ncbi:hypothetical protein NC653_034766 [Populus alba x Populus x berolinensis]|uniref:Uncharacterized protein n=2 Tax=Populus TaxID=3689 RepID=A0A4V6ACE4_POPAL|nr:hypothetical protein NC653_034766 [Populus alba x Populus x berolinensis]TKS16136.1 hypothetical protein D5086_0000027090 [Populus alba]
MGDGQPIGRYNDMWDGWCSKVICDHMGWGVKTGLPYIWHGKASNPFVNLKKECKGIYWAKLGKVDEYFIKLADEMVTWVGAWDELNQTGKSSEVPDGAAK